MTIEDLRDELEFSGMTGAYLHKLWKYHERVRTDLKSDLLEFRSSGLPDDLKGLRCARTCYYGDGPSLPQWVDHYIESIGEAHHLVDLIEIDNARA